MERILNRLSKHGDLKEIEEFITDSISVGYYTEIKQILENHREDFSKQSVSESAKSAKTMRNICDPLKIKDIDANR